MNILTHFKNTPLEKILTFPLRITLREKSVFFRILTTLLFSGIPLLKALFIAEKKIKNEALREIVHIIASKIEQGESLSRSMRSYPHIFQEADIGLIEAGERTGTIDQSVRRISEDLEKYIELKNKVISTLLYPVIVLTILAAVSILIAIFVVPTLVNIFTSQKAAVPLPLEIISLFSNFILNYGFILLAGVAVGAIYLQKLLQKRERKQVLHELILSIPVYGNVLKRSALIMTCYTFSTLMEAELPILQILDLLSRSQPLIPYQIAFDEMKKAIINGESIKNSIPEESSLFPDDFREMIGIGESTATLKDILKKTAQQYSMELEYELKNMTTIIEPVALILVAVFIGIFAFSVLGSIFDLISTISS